MLQLVSDVSSFLRLSDMHGMYIPCFVHPVIHQWSLGYFTFGIVDNVAMNMSVKILFESMLSIRWGIYPERESLDQVLILCLVV